MQLSTCSLGFQKKYKPFSTTSEDGAGDKEAGGSLAHKVDTTKG